MLGFIVFYNSISLNHANILFFCDFVNIIFSPRNAPTLRVWHLIDFQLFKESRRRPSTPATFDKHLTLSKLAITLKDTGSAPAP